MVIDSKYIKEMAIKYGAAVCGIAGIDRFSDEIPERNPRSVCPKAKSVIGFGFYVPSGLYRAMENGNQNYLYTSVGVKYIDEEFSTIFLFRMASIIEDAGYDACLQRTVPNMKISGDKSANPFMTDDFLKGHPEREAILNGDKHFNADEAREIIKQIDFLPMSTGYSPCLCGKKCDYVCFKHLKEAGII